MCFELEFELPADWFAVWLALFDTCSVRMHRATLAVLRKVRGGLPTAAAKHTDRVPESALHVACAPESACARCSLHTPTDSVYASQ